MYCHSFALFIIFHPALKISVNQNKNQMAGPFPMPTKSLTDLTADLLFQWHNLELVGSSSSFEGWLNPVPNY
jgi:hypothetical protein